MIDPQLLKTNIEAIEENLRKRDLDIDLDKLKLLDESRRALKFESESYELNKKNWARKLHQHPKKKKFST